MTKGMINNRFGRLRVVRKVGANKHGATRWLCCCECGNFVTVITGSLTSGHTKSCGCQKIDSATRHGLDGDLTFRVWQHMLKRCHDSTYSDFQRWGGRGITVCDRWQSFDNFLADMGARPSDEFSIERMDNDRNYEPGNCCWLKKWLQARNRRDTLFIELNGERLSFAEHAERAGVDYHWAYYRVVTKGMAPSEILGSH